MVTALDTWRVVSLGTGPPNWIKAIGRHSPQGPPCRGLSARPGCILMETKHPIFSAQMQVTGQALRVTLWLMKGLTGPFPRLEEEQQPVILRPCDNT